MKLIPAGVTAPMAPVDGLDVRLMTRRTRRTRRTLTDGSPWLLVLIGLAILAVIGVVLVDLGGVSPDQIPVLGQFLTPAPDGAVGFPWADQFVAAFQAVGLLLLLVAAIAAPIYFARRGYLEPSRWLAVAGACLLVWFLSESVFSATAANPYYHDRRGLVHAPQAAALVAFAGAISCLLAAVFHRKMAQARVSTAQAASVPSDVWGWLEARLPARWRDRLEGMTPGRWACLAGALLLVDWVWVVWGSATVDVAARNRPWEDHRLSMLGFALPGVALFFGGVGCLVAAAFHRPRVR